MPIMLRHDFILLGQDRLYGVATFDRDLQAEH